jgi:hypothetical protein
MERERMCKAGIRSREKGGSRSECEPEWKCSLEVQVQVRVQNVSLDVSANASGLEGNVWSWQPTRLAKDRCSRIAGVESCHRPLIRERGWGTDEGVAWYKRHQARPDPCASPSYSNNA